MAHTIHYACTKCKCTTAYAYKMLTNSLCRNISHFIALALKVRVIFRVNLVHISINLINY